MPSEWRTLPLGEFVTLQRGFDLPDHKRQQGNVPILGSFGITGFHSSAKVQGPGVTVGRSGASFGVVTYSDADFWPLNTALYVKNFHGNNERFAYYFLKQFDFKCFNSGSAQPSLNRNAVHPVPIRIPQRGEQDSIAELLGAIDDRIESLKEASKTLESLGRAIFKSWFVDFDPVKAKAEGREPEAMDAATAALFPSAFQDSEVGQIPVGWEVLPLDAIAGFLNGLALQKFPVRADETGLPAIKIAELRARSSQGADRVSGTVPEQYVIHDGDLLFSWSGSLEVDFWCGGDGALNQHLFKVHSTDYPRFFYYFWLQQHLPSFREIAADKATTMGHIQRRHLQEALVFVPSPQILQRAGELIEPLVEQLIQSRLRQHTLASLRDTLLPRLISGKLRVPEAEEMLAEVV